MKDKLGNNNKNILPKDIRPDIVQFIERQVQIERDRIREDLIKDVDKHKRSLTHRVSIWVIILSVVIAIVGVTVNFNIRDTIRGVEKTIVQRLDREFKTERIRTLVEEKAKEYAEREAKAYIAERVEETIIPFTEEINKNIAESESKLKVLEQIILLYECEAGARFGSRYNYEQLLKLSKEETAYKDVALIRAKIIQKEYAIYKSPPRIYTGLDVKKEGKKISFEELSTKEMFDWLENLTVSDKERHIMMAYIIDKPKKEVLSEAIRILKSSNSLPACVATCGLLSDILGRKVKFFNFDDWIEICEEELKKQHNKE